MSLTLTRELSDGDPSDDQVIAAALASYRDQTVRQIARLTDIAANSTSSRGKVLASTWSNLTAAKRRLAIITATIGRLAP